MVTIHQGHIGNLAVRVSTFLDGEDMHGFISTNTIKEFSCLCNGIISLSLTYQSQGSAGNFFKFIFDVELGDLLGKFLEFLTP